MIKKISLIIFSTISLLFFQEVGAVSYNLGNQRTIPAVGQGSNIYYTVGINPGFTYNSPVTSTVRLLSSTHLIVFGSGITNTLTGFLMGINFSANDSNFSGEDNWINYNLVKSGSRTALNYTITTRRNPNNTLVNPNPINTVDSGLALLLPDNLADCVGATKDCILVISPKFYGRSSLVAPGLYIPYIDYYWYYNEERKMFSYRQFFGTVNGDISAWSSFTSVFTGYNTDYGLYVSPYTGFSNGIARSHGTLPNTFFYHYSLGSAPASNSTILEDYFLGPIPGRTVAVLDQYFPSWVSASGGTYNSGNNYNSGSVGGNGSNSSGSTDPGWIDTDAYFTQCSSWLDIGCYIRGFFSGFFDSVKNWFKNIWSYLFPTISFNGMSETCIDNINNSSGSLSASGSNLPFLQTVSNLFVILVPVAPPNGSTVCTFEGPKVMNYRSDTAGVVDILFVLFAFVPIIFSFRSSHD